MSRISRIASAATLAAVVSIGAPATVSAQDVPAEVTYRQSIMQAISTNLRQLRAVGTVNQPTHTVHYARAMYGLGEMFGDAFEGGSPANSRALPAVWQNRAQFNEQVTAFEAATAQLLEAAEMRNQAAITQAVQAVGATCASCHQVFRGPAN